MAVAMVLATVGCHHQVSSDSLGGLVATHETGNVGGVDNDFRDKALKANESLDDFLGAFADRKWGKGKYLLKSRFTTSDGGEEHMWVEVMAMSQSKFSGKLSNAPLHCPNLKQGQAVSCELTSVSDWLYVDGSFTKGGFTAAP